MISDEGCGRAHHAAPFLLPPWLARRPRKPRKRSEVLAGGGSAAGWCISSRRRQCGRQVSHGRPLARRRSAAGWWKEWVGPTIGQPCCASSSEFGKWGESHPHHWAGGTGGGFVRVFHFEAGRGLGQQRLLLLRSAGLSFRRLLSRPSAHALQLRARLRQRSA